MTGTTDGTGGGSGMTHEQMERDARKVIFAQGVASARGVGNPAIERAIPQARNVLSLLEEVERIRDAATISVTIAQIIRDNPELIAWLQKEISS